MLIFEVFDVETDKPQLKFFCETYNLTNLIKHDKTADKIANMQQKT